MKAERIWPIVVFRDEKFHFKNRLAKLRARHNMRQSDLARDVDVSRQTILAIENGRDNPSVIVAHKIAQVFGEPTDYVFYLERTETTSAETIPCNQL